MLLVFQSRPKVGDNYKPILLAHALDYMGSIHLEMSLIAADDFSMHVMVNCQLLKSPFGKIISLSIVVHADLKKPAE